MAALVNERSFTSDLLILPKLQLENKLLSTSKAFPLSQALLCFNITSLFQKVYGQRHCIYFLPTPLFGAVPSIFKATDQTGVCETKIT